MTHGFNGEYYYCTDHDFRGRSKEGYEQHLKEAHNEND